MNIGTPALTYLTAFESDVSSELRRHLFWSRMKDEGLSITTTEVQGYIIDSCLARFDEQTAVTLLRDWKNTKTKQSAYVHKYQPGSHYYALDEKFDTELEAREHLERNGYQCLGITVRYVYARQSD